MLSVGMFRCWLSCSRACSCSLGVCAWLYALVCAVLLYHVHGLLFCVVVMHAMFVFICVFSYEVASFPLCVFNAVVVRSYVSLCCSWCYGIVLLPNVQFVDVACVVVHVHERCVSPCRCAIGHVSLMYLCVHVYGCAELVCIWLCMSYLSLAFSVVL